MKYTGAITVFLALALGAEAQLRGRDSGARGYRRLGSMSMMSESFSGSIRGSMGMMSESFSGSISINFTTESDGSDGSDGSDASSISSVSSVSSISSVSSVSSTSSIDRRERT